MLSALMTWMAVLPVPQENPGGIVVPKPETTQFAPFADSQGQPVAHETAAGGAADMDGDGNPDLWFLAGPGPNQGQLSVQMARTMSLGTYRPWHSYAPDSWTDAATFHSASYSQDRILMASPTKTGLGTAVFQRAISGDPRLGSWFNTPNFWLFDTGIFEVETRDDSGDGHDDVAVLIQASSGSTKVLKLVIADEGLGPQVQTTVAVQVPAALTTLRLLDLDGDGRSDFAAVVPGAGLVLFRDNGAGSFDLVLAIPTPIPIRDLFAGDLLDIGQDALGVCIDEGLLIGCFTPAGLLPYWLPRLPGMGALATAEILADHPDFPRVVAVPRSAQGIAVYPFAPAALAFGPGSLHTPDDPVPYAGPGTMGMASFAADVDSDGDRDILLQMASGKTWVTLTNNARSLRLENVTITELGEIGETGFVKQQFRFDLRAEWDAQAIQNAEAAVYLKHPTTDYTYYWGRLLPVVDPSARTVTFTVYTQTDPVKLVAMHSSSSPYQFADGITAGGESAITVHGISVHNFEDTKRYQSVHMYNEGIGGGNGSGSGHSWTMTSAPPLPSTEDDMLPWGGG